MLLAQTRLDRVKEAANLTELICEATAELPEQRLSPSCESAIAEYYIGVGMIPQAQAHIDALTTILTTSPDPRWTSRATTLSAAAHALAGDFASAERLLGEHEQMVSSRRLNHESIDFMAAVAKFVIYYTRMDRPRLRNLASQMERRAAVNPDIQLLAMLIQSVCYMIEGEPYHALPLARRVEQGLDQPTGASLIRNLATLVAGKVLVQRGSPQQALAFLNGVESSGQHLVCMGYVRSAAYLQLRDYHEALRATSACVRERSTHCRWMLGAVLLRRAIANHRLGNDRAALQEASEALLISGRNSPAAGMFLLPPEDIDALGWFLLQRAPHLAPKLLRIRSLLHKTPPTVAPPLVLPALTPRERVIARYLSSDLTKAEIADELHVAHSTVKSQITAIFKKLGVGNREDAVALLERSGFYEFSAHIPG